MEIILVLGKTLNPDGSPTPELAAQLARAIRLAREDPRRMIALTGGVTRRGAPSEAEGAYALLPGDLQERTRFENRSKSTKQNIVFIKEAFRGINVDSIIVVSSPAHTRRTRYLLRKLWPEATKISFDSVGTSSLGQYAMHAVYYMLTVIDPNEKIFLPVQKMISKGGS